MDTGIYSKQKIVPHLWFDDQAEEAARFYVSTFLAIGKTSSQVGSITRYGKAAAAVSGQPEGAILTVEFELQGQAFIALNGGPEFSLTPAVSFYVHCTTEEEVDQLWAKLSDGGEILMPLDNYPFSKKYGWANDRFGVSWQVILADSPQEIVPCLMFVGEQHGKAEEAITFYASLFDNSEILALERYGPGHEMDPPDTIVHGRFTLVGQHFVAMDSGLAHDFTFTEATSFLVNCETQKEVDDLWEKLTAGGEEQPCGWLKDRYGVSWQIVPTVLTRMLEDKDTEKAERVMEAMLQMKKIEIDALKEAYGRDTVS